MWSVRRNKKWGKLYGKLDATNNATNNTMFSFVEVLNASSGNVSMNASSGNVSMNAFSGTVSKNVSAPNVSKNASKNVSSWTGPVHAKFGPETGYSCILYRNPLPRNLLQPNVGGVVAQTGCEIRKIPHKQTCLRRVCLHCTHLWEDYTVDYKKAHQHGRDYNRTAFSVTSSPERKKCMELCIIGQCGTWAVEAVDESMPSGKPGFRCVTYGHRVPKKWFAHVAGSGGLLGQMPCMVKHRNIKEACKKPDVAARKSEVKKCLDCERTWRGYVLPVADKKKAAFFGLKVGG